MEARKVQRAGLRAGVTMMLLGFFIPGSAWAQEQNPEEKHRKPVIVLEPVTVTAEKQEATAQDAPLSLTVLDETTIEDRMIESVDDFVHFVPNMSSFDTATLGENVITMRGITAPATTRSTSTAMYIDGVPVLSSFGYTSGLMDIERIEVLRGPQGTLYGKSTEAGAVSVITAKPGNTFQAKAVGEGGMMLSSKDGDKLLGSAGASLKGPLVRDNLYFSLAGKAEHKDGFIKNITTNKTEYERENYFGTGSLRWTPVEDLDMTFSFTREKWRADGSNANASGAPNRVVASDLPAKQNLDVDMEALNVAYNVTDNIKLTSVTARRNSKLNAGVDMDYTSMEIIHGFVDGKKESISQELRLNGTHGDWEWMAGAYIDREEGEYKATTTSIIPMFATKLHTKVDGDSYAGFTHVGYNLTPKLKLIGGLRYEYQEQKFNSNMLANSQTESWDNISPKFGLEYKISPEVMTYATVAQGYRPGGFNERSFNPAYYKYEPEKLWSYELGVKSTLLDKKLIVNTAIFYMDISDKQVEEQVSMTENYITNAGEATSMGAELEFTAILTEGLMLNGGFGYTHAEFDKFKDLSGDYKHNKLPYAPEYTYNVGGQYRAQNGIYARVDVSGYGKAYFDKENTSYRNAYALVDFKVGYEMEHCDVYLYGKNIFDTEHDIKNWNRMDVYSEPGEVGVQLVARF